ncbi:MAG: hypothetical protein WC254_00225 [Candidatus Woesearchaeota archaeon]
MVEGSSSGNPKMDIREISDQGRYAHALRHGLVALTVLETPAQASVEPVLEEAIIMYTGYPPVEALEVRVVTGTPSGYKALRHYQGY